MQVNKTARRNAQLLLSASGVRDVVRNCGRYGMGNLQMLATPWWVNLAVVVPVGSYFLWRKKGLLITWPQLFYATLFAIGFGINEAIVVVYLRAAAGLVSDVYQPAQLLGTLPRTEIFREAATILMLIGVSFLAAKSPKERWAFFLWTFAFWDIFYYVGLWLAIQWPPSFLTEDVLFLIPVPWIAQVWFPVSISLLTIGAVLAARIRKAVSQ